MNAALIAGMALNTAAGCEDAPALKGSSGQKAKTPGGAFAKMMALVNTSNEPKADNPVTEKASAQVLGENLGENGELPPQFSKASVCTLMTDSSTPQTPKTTSVRRTREAPEPGGLVPVVWDMAAVCPNPPATANGTHQKAVTLNGVIPEVGKGMLKGQESTEAILVNGEGHRTHVTPQTDLQHKIPQQTAVPIDTAKAVPLKEASVPADKAMVSIPPASDKRDNVGDMTGSEGVLPDQKEKIVAKTAAPATAQERDVEVKRGDGTAFARQVSESSVLQAKVADKNATAGPEQARQASRPETQTPIEEPLVEALNVSDSGAGALHSEESQSVPVPGNSQQTRQTAEAGISPVTARGANPLHADGGVPGQSPMMALESGRSMMVAENPPSSAPMTAGTFEGAAAHDPAGSVGQQILDSVHASLTRGEQQVVIRLRPPELGSVLVRFGQDDDGLQGVLEVGRSDTRRQIEQALPEMLRSLQELGVQVRRIDVTVAEQSENDTGRGQAQQQDAWAQQQGFREHDDQPQRSSGGGWTAGPEDHDGVESAETMHVSTHMPADRIDMLA